MTDFRYFLCVQVPVTALVGILGGQVAGEQVVNVAQYLGALPEARIEVTDRVEPFAVRLAEYLATRGR